jgi:hypothetical protein
MSKIFGNTILLNDQYVNQNTLEVDGVDTRDYPDFCDAYLSYAEFTNGTPLNEEELIEFQEEYPEIVDELIYDSLF